MPNTLFTPTQAARSTLAALRYLTTLPRTVHQNFDAEFAPGRGATINIRRPISAGTARVYTAANRTARDAIVFDDLADSVIPVTLTDQVYKAVRLPDDFNTFTLVNAQTQVFVPQAEAVVDGVTAPLLVKMNAVAADGVTVLAADGANILDVIIDAREKLNERKVPAGDRFLAVSPSFESAILRKDTLQRVNESGSSGVLRTATIGTLFGFTIVSDPGIATGTAIAYHRDAFVHVTRPSAIPEGAGFAATVAQDGFALRWLRHYNPLQLEDQSVVDTFVGAETVDAVRAVKLTTGV